MMEIQEQHNFGKSVMKPPRQSQQKFWLEEPRIDSIKQIRNSASSKWSVWWAWSAWAWNQYVEITIKWITYKILHDWIV